MPELPEVETIKRTLEHLVVGKMIEQVEIFWPNIIKQPDEKQFCKWLMGQTIQGMDRRGKFLKFLLNDYVLVSHLRMEGRFRVHDREDERTKHVHAIFTFTDGTELRYQDVRKFGTMHLFRKGEEELAPPLINLGVEPFSPQFTPEYLFEKLQKTTRTIKQALLDQQIVVGLGNIYVDETLFRANIHPQRTAKDVTREETDVLHRCIVETLSEAVELGGTTVRSYVNSQGNMGMFQQNLFVYGRKNEPCQICMTPIEKIKVGGRGTHFCPNCQK